MVAATASPLSIRLNSSQCLGKHPCFPLLPYLEGRPGFTRAWRVRGESGQLAFTDPTTHGGPANTKAIFTYTCPADPSLSDGIVAGGIYGGTSYAVNAQVFARLADETIAGGAMYPSSQLNFTDRGVPLSAIKDGTSNIIMFTHSYAICGSGTGTIWGYGAGVNQPPSPIDTYQPWSRASYLSQTFMTPANAAPFQVRPTNCSVSDPATPHVGMMVCLGDASVRAIAPGIAPDTWNKACLPNDGNMMPEDW